MKAAGLAQSNAFRCQKPKSSDPLFRHATGRDATAMSGGTARSPPVIRGDHTVPLLAAKRTDWLSLFVSSMRRLIAGGAIRSPLVKSIRYDPFAKRLFFGFHVVFDGASTCSRVIMMGKWPGGRKFASWRRVATYSGVAAPHRISPVESNHVMASPS